MEAIFLLCTPEGLSLVKSHRQRQWFTCVLITGFLKRPFFTHRQVLAGEGFSFGKSKALGWGLGENFSDSSIEDPSLTG
ncbi:hypothetical protein [Microbulbifer sp. TRSA005]|uniref:hypothetical protein n=1 Tax=Microbulbifer sp. TRSA005 TaxID=3243383 RepID=UPI004039C135